MSPADYTDEIKNLRFQRNQRADLKIESKADSI